ncbi:hypothetical protein CRC_01656 [Cylindrospermopsis raciborskii CS-505]|nr:hypothetical protein CRC_01656 [Cylindrospermopsis raciborskii CS-505]
MQVLISLARFPLGSGINGNGKKPTGVYLASTTPASLWEVELMETDHETQHHDHHHDRPLPSGKWN